MSVTTLYRTRHGDLLRVKHIQRFLPTTDSPTLTKKELLDAHPEAMLVNHGVQWGKSVVYRTFNGEYFGLMSKRDWEDFMRDYCLCDESGIPIQHERHCAFHTDWKKDGF